MAGSGENAFVVLVEKYDEQIEAYRTAAGDGACKDFAAYRELVGKIAGLEQARMLAKDLQDVIEHA